MPRQSRWPKATFDRCGLSVRPAHVRDAYWVLSQLPLCSPIFIQGNLAHALLFQGHYDEALAIYRHNWDKPLFGKTFGEVTLEDFVAFDKAGLTHPNLSRMKRALGDLHSKAPKEKGEGRGAP
jgi:hypothetical protein